MKALQRMAMVMTTMMEIEAAALLSVTPCTKTDQLPAVIPSSWFPEDSAEAAQNPAGCRRGGRCHEARLV